METIKMSTKGQIVIPLEIRKEINVDEGTLFAIIANKDTIILKKIETPSKEMLIKELQNLAKEGKKHLESRRIKEKDIPDIVEKSRRK